MCGQLEIPFADALEMSVEFKRKASRSRTDVRDTIDGCVVIVYDLFCFLWFRSRKVVATLGFSGAHQEKYLILSSKAQMKRYFQMETLMINERPLKLAICLACCWLKQGAQTKGREVLHWKIIISY